MTRCLVSRVLLLLAILSIMAACNANPNAASSLGAPPARPPRSAKRIVLGLLNDPDLRPSGLAASRPVVYLVHTGLTVMGDQRLRRSGLAEAVPTLENGLWAVSPDGRMTTTWTIRPGAHWHDGTPVTSEDVVFSLQVGRDRDMTAFASPGYGSIEDVSAPDSKTVRIEWKALFIDADALLDTRSGGLLPKHLLAESYLNEKASFLDIPYWTTQFIGAGPYRLRAREPGVSMFLDAEPDFPLGRPRIDTIELRLIPDPNALTANLLAGTVDLAPNTGGTDLAVQLRDQWRAGSVLFNAGADNWTVMFPQFLDPSPLAVTDLTVRRALVHAIDRQEMADTLTAGTSPVAHSFLSPGHADYRDIEAAIPRYEYDPRRAAELLDGAGYRKGADGIYRDRDGGQLPFEVRGTNAKPVLAVADFWQRLGVMSTAVQPSVQQFQDPEYQATFPAFLIVTGPNDVLGLRYLHSSQTRLLSNGYRVAAAGNRSRYMNPAFDALLDQYFATIPLAERREVLGQIVSHIADQVTLVGLYYNLIPAAATSRLLNLSRDWDAFFLTWNAHEWDLTGSKAQRRRHDVGMEASSNTTMLG